MPVDRKENILDAASKSFALFGYKGTTMDQVAKIANVGKGTIYTFFENKEELFDEIIGSLIEEMKKIAEQSIDPERGFFENLHEALYGILAFRKEHQLAIKLWQEVKEIGTPAAKLALERFESAILSFIADKIRGAVENKKLKPCDPELTAFILFKLYVALVFDWEEHHPPLGKEEIDHYLQLYLENGLTY